MFTESWDARQFHAGHDRAIGELSHSWSYRVASNHKVAFRGDSGNVAPQLAEVYRQVVYKLSVNVGGDGFEPTASSV